MPIYEYQCKQCNHKMELLQKVNDPVISTCPACEKETLEKLVSASGFVLKGTGWYESDFKNKSSGDTGGQTSAASPPKESKPTTDSTNKTGE